MLNAALARARNRWVVCAHQDVYLPEGWDRRLVRRLGEAEGGFGPLGVAGVIGTSANIGIFCMSTLATQVHVTPDAWRWALLVGAAPLALGLFSLVAVPESPRWLAARDAARAARPAG